MSTYEQVYQLLDDTLQAYHPFYREDFLKWQIESDIPRNWFTLNAVRASEPQAYSLEKAQQINPYTSPDRLRDQLDDLVENDYLLSEQPGTYKLTDRGRTVIEGFFKTVQARMDSMVPISPNELNQAKVILQKLVNATITAPKPEVKLALQGSRWTDPGPDATTSVAIDQAVTDLLQFRDDAHIAAWQPLGVSGQTWEALTLIWRDEANDPSAVAERQAFRGYSREDYEDSIKQLEKLGWVRKDSGRYVTTDEGSRIREEAEQETDRIYFRPWERLESNEFEQLENLLRKVITQLNQDDMIQFWSLATELSLAISPVTRETVQAAFQEHFDDNAVFFIMLTAIGHEPEPYSTRLYQKRFAFSNAEVIERRFQAAVAEGKMTVAGDDGYLLTEGGKSALTAVNDIFYRMLGEIDPLEVEESAELAGFLERLVKASLEATEPLEKWGINNMHNCHSRKEYGPLATIDQRLDDLGAFRDDAHNAAWKIHDISPMAWEAFTYFWRGEATSASELAGKLTFRGYSAGDYDTALSDLAGKGWLERGQDGFRLTPKGKKIRQEAEDATNAIFFTPWETLSGDEKFRLRDLLIRMKLGLEALHPNTET